MAESNSKTNFTKEYYKDFYEKFSQKGRIPIVEINRNKFTFYAINKDGRLGPVYKILNNFCIPSTGILFSMFHIKKNAILCGHAAEYFEKEMERIKKNNSDSTLIYQSSIDVFGSFSCGIFSYFEVLSKTETREVFFLNNIGSVYMKKFINNVCRKQEKTIEIFYLTSEAQEDLEELFRLDGFTESEYTWTNDATGNLLRLWHGVINPRDDSDDIRLREFLTENTGCCGVSVIGGSDIMNNLKEDDIKYNTVGLLFTTRTFDRQKDYFPNVKSKIKVYGEEY